jgi:hypothetical protein
MVSSRASLGVRILLPTHERRAESRSLLRRQPMSEGRSELEKAIEVWERRHVAAVQAKREAEVVMPFLRAAVEELDSFHAGNQTAAAVTPEPVAQEPAPVAFSGNFAPVQPEAVEEPANLEAPTEFPNVFQSRGIASLMTDEDEGSDDEAAVV